MLAHLFISEDQVTTHWVVSDDLITTHLLSVEKLTDDFNDPLMTPHNHTNLVMTEMTTLVEINHPKLDIFWQLSVLLILHA